MPLSSSCINVDIPSTCELSLYTMYMHYSFHSLQQFMQQKSNLEANLRSLAHELAAALGDNPRAVIPSLVAWCVCSYINFLVCRHVQFLCICELMYLFLYVLYMKHFSCFFLIFFSCLHVSILFTSIIILFSHCNSMYYAITLASFVILCDTYLPSHYIM